MNRKALADKRDRIREGDAATVKARAEVEAARKVRDAWRKPEDDLRAAVAKLEAATSAADRDCNRIDAELRENAREIVEPYRAHLCELHQQTRGKYEQSGPYSNARAVAERLQALRDAIRECDDLMVSSEDPRAGVARIKAKVPYGPLGDGLLDAERQVKQYEETPVLTVR